MVGSDPQAAAGPPRVSGVLETVLYFTDQERAARFYGGVLGFRLIDEEPGRSLFYRAGESVLLLFDAGRSREPGSLPAHGASGPIHTCFRVPPGALAAWRSHLAAQGVAVLKEVEWPRGRSIYFHDPDRNLLELADADIWPR